MQKTLVQICNTEWEIRVVTPRTIREKYGDKNSELDGFTDFDNQRIYLNKELHPYRLGVTLAHEWLHVIADASGDYTEEQQEKYIRRIEHGVYEMVHKFPDIFKKHEVK
jgi:Zn-dependent peptidase ImmA (M78 family)